MSEKIEFAKFEDQLITLADKLLPITSTHITKNESIKSFVVDPLSATYGKYRRKRDGNSCNGGRGRYGFNTYNLLTFTILSFNLAANLISNSNNNLNNNNNNNNENDLGTVSSNSQDTDVNSNSMSMVMVTVPPVGPPVVVPIGKAIFPNVFDFNRLQLQNVSNISDYDPMKDLREPKIYLDERFDVPQDSFYLDINKGMKSERRIFANGTIISRRNNTRLTGNVFYGLVDPRNTKKIYPMSKLYSFLQKPKEDTNLSLNEQLSHSNLHISKNSDEYGSVDPSDQRGDVEVSRSGFDKDSVVDLHYLRILNQKRKYQIT